MFCRYEAALKNKSLWGTGPRLYEPTFSKDLLVSGVTFQNSPSWTVHPTFCDGFVGDNIKILNPRFTPNTDGFDPVNLLFCNDSTLDIAS